MVFLASPVLLDLQVRQLPAFPVRLDQLAAGD